MVTAEQLEIRALAREFAEGEIRPHASRWDEARALDDGIFTKLGELGFMGMLVPEAHGGLGLDTSTFLHALEELAWGDAAVALSVAIQNGPASGLILAHGSDAQRSELLPRMASGELLVAFALSEAGSGSDAGSLRARAVREGDGWRLSGSKRWVTNGRRAGRVLVFARTEEGTGGRGIGAFLVDPRAPGYGVGDRETTMGLRASETVSVSLHDVVVGADAVVGDPGRGFVYAMESIDRGRLAVAAQAVGIAQAALEHSRSYALERHQFGSAIGSFGAIQAKVAEMVIRIEASRALLHEVARRNDAGGPEGAGDRTADAAMTKVLASETAMWTANQAVQIFGGYGYMRDYPVEKLMRDAKGTEIYEGTNEILRMLVARQHLGRAEN